FRRMCDVNRPIYQAETRASDLPLKNRYQLSNQVDSRFVQRSPCQTQGPIQIFTKYAELNSILKKVLATSNHFLDEIISSPLNYTLTSLMKSEHPELIDRLRTSAFTNLSTIFHETIPEDDNHEYVMMVGLMNGKRVKRFVRRDYINDGSSVLDKYNLLVTKANGAGDFGETLSASIIARPGVAYTQTFIGIGSFDSIEEAEAVSKYTKTKFARAMLGVLKITQDCPGPKWKYVPLQDFTINSDINWSKPIPDVDRQLYSKYGLSTSEIDFIETHVQEMD
ncbi:MAG: hypothetical protein IKR86_07200, partial [Candidatus Methanomethylophilaceae archaeon]|nr:hypothetical protein [Candidatus Methanomethylophilaceae archaeon]